MQPPRVWQPLWRRHRMISRQAEVLARGSAIFLGETNGGPSREWTLVVIVNAAGRAVLHFL